MYLPFDPPGVKVPVDLWMRPGRYARRLGKDPRDLKRKALGKGKKS